MTTRFKFLSGTTLPLGVTLIFALIAALVSARQFVGWPLNATELDFVIMNRILGMRDAFEGTVYLALAENVSRLSILPSLIGLLDAGGIAVERQVVYLNIIQALFMCLGPAAVFWVTTRDRNPWVTPLALLLFLLSGKHLLAYFKLVTSTFVSGFVIMAVAFGAARRYRVVAVLMGIIGIIHPTYFLVTVGAIFFMQWCSSGPLLSPKGVMARLSPLKPCLFAVVPIVGYWLFNYGIIAQPQENKELWFSYMQARSDLAFPLRQGIFSILDISWFLLIAGLVFRREGKNGDDPGFTQLFWMTLFSIALVVVQILASEFIRSASLTRLALSHRIGFAFAIVTYAGLIAVMLRRFASGQGPLLWLVALLVVILGPSLPQIPAIGLNEKSMFALLVLSLQALEGVKLDLQRKVSCSWQVPVWLGVGLIVALVWGGGAYRMMVLIIVLMAFELLLAFFWTGHERWGGRLKPFVVAGFLILCSAQYVKKTDWKTVRGDWQDFLAGNAVDFDLEYRKGRSEYRDFIRFVTDNVEPAEQILTVPFFLTQRFTPTPYRAVYLDWPESNYVLYMGNYTQNVVEKLATYGIDPNKRSPECNICAMIRARGGDDAYRCQRKALQAQAMHEDMAWRGNIPKIKELSPKVSWVLIRKEAICNGDQIVARWDDFSLMRLDGAVPFAECERKP
jgi:hypothetical protein